MIGMMIVVSHESIRSHVSPILIIIDSWFFLS